MHHLPPGYRYSGPLTAAIFDWAGTVLDFGCLAPVAAFREAFSEVGIEISEVQAREPMGAAKREHLERILAQPLVQKSWHARFGASSTQDDVDALYATFLRIDEVNCSRYSALIPGARETIATLRSRGLLIGSTTGYPRSIIDGLMPLAEAQGYRPDCCITVSEARRGRPAPDMPLMNAVELGAPDVSACVVIDDSPTGLSSGRAAGMWTVGIVASGNEVGLPLKEWSALCDAARNDFRLAATRKFEAAGAHYSVDTIADLLPVVDAINLRLAAGERP